MSASVATARQDAQRLKHRAQRALEDAVYYFWVGVGVACGAVTVARFLLPPPKRPAKARL